MESHFHKLPKELQLKVLSYADTLSIIILCSAYRSLEDLSHDRNTIRYANFFKQYKCEKNLLLQFLTKAPRCEYITVLNINSVYWVSKKELLNGITQLTSIESLYAVDTQMGVTPAECSQYLKFTRLKKIGLNIRNYDITITRSCLYSHPNLVGVYLHVYEFSRSTCTFIQMLMRQLGTLKELWIINCDSRHFDLNDVISYASFLKSATFSIIPSHRIVFETFSSVIKTFLSKNAATQFTFEKRRDGVDIYRNHLSENLIWRRIFDELLFRGRGPFGPKDARKLALQQHTLENIKFEDLNFSHQKKNCYQDFANVVYKVLLSPNTSYLKKLSISFCICHGTWTPEQDDAIEVELASFKDISKNCPHIEELEIWGCDRVHEWRMFNLKYIENFEKLKSLTVTDIPVYVDGSFLIEVCKSCLELKSLRIKIALKNAELDNNLLEALKYAKNLKDFRFEQNSIPIRELLQTFITYNKIERLFLRCHESKEFLKLLEMFLSENSQLIFFAIAINKIPYLTSKMPNIKKILKNHKRSQTQCFYFIPKIRFNRDENDRDSFPSIPEVHYHELVELNSAVAVLDIFNGFV